MKSLKLINFFPQTYCFRVNRGGHQNHFFSWIQKFVNDHHEKIHFLGAFMHFVQNDMRVMVQWFGMNQFLQQNTRRTIQYTRVFAAIRLLIGTHLVADDFTDFPATFLANALCICLCRNSEKKKTVSNEWNRMTAKKNKTKTKNSYEPTRLCNNNIAVFALSTSIVQNVLRHLRRFTASRRTLQHNNSIFLDCGEDFVATGGNWQWIAGTMIFEIIFVVNRLFWIFIFVRLTRSNIEPLQKRFCSSMKSLSFVFAFCIKFHAYHAQMFMQVLYIFVRIVGCTGKYSARFDFRGGRHFSGATSHSSTRHIFPNKWFAEVE